MQGASGRLWRTVAAEFVETAEKDWPSRLCSFEQAQQIGVNIEIETLRVRFQKLAKSKPNMARKRAAALKIIAESGQLVTPAEDMSLWQYFKPSENRRSA